MNIILKRMRSLIVLCLVLLIQLGSVNSYSQEIVFPDSLGRFDVPQFRFVYYSPIDSTYHIPRVDMHVLDRVFGEVPDLKSEIWDFYEKEDAWEKLLAARDSTIKYNYKEIGALDFQVNSLQIDLDECLEKVKESVPVVEENTETVEDLEASRNRWKKGFWVVAAPAFSGAIYGIIEAIKKWIIK